MTLKIKQLAPSDKLATTLTEKTSSEGVSDTQIITRGAAYQQIDGTQCCYLPTNQLKHCNKHESRPNKLQKKK